MVCEGGAVPAQSCRMVGVADRLGVAAGFVCSDQASTSVMMPLCRRSNSSCSTASTGSPWSAVSCAASAYSVVPCAASIRCCSETS